jgi:hypothetical protein
MSEVKSFWERPEGNAGKVVLLLTLLAGIYGAYVGLPYLIILLSNTLYAAFLLGAIVLLAFLISSTQVRMFVGGCFKALMQFLFALDPIIVIEGYIQTMNKNLYKMQGQITNLKRQMGSLENVMKTNEKERVHSLQIAKQCAPGEPEFRLQTANAGRLQTSNDEIKKSWTQLDIAYRTLNSMKEKADILIKDFTSQVSIQKRQREALRASNGAFRSAMLVIKGDPEQKYIADQAMENLANQIGEQLGEMDQFMDMSVTILRNAELQDAVDQEAGMKMLQEWSKSPSILLGSQKAVLLSEAPGVSQAPVKSNYTDLFGN